MMALRQAKDVNEANRASSNIPIQTWPIDEPQRVGLGVAAEARIVVPVPVVVQAGLDLEPLAREARVERGGTSEALRLAQAPPYRVSHRGFGGVDRRDQALRGVRRR